MASSLRSNLTFLSLCPSTTQPINTSSRSCVTIRCGPRDTRGPLVKGRVLSIEAIQAVQSLKRANKGDQTKLNDLLSKTLSRLIKSDLIATFNELLRQDQCHLALEVFSAVRSEPWYRTDLTLYGDLVSALARNEMWDDIDRLIGDLEGESVIPCDKGLLRLIKAVIAAGRAESTVRIYGLMKRSGWGSTCEGDEYVAKVLSRGLKRFGKESLANEVDMEIDRSSRGILEKVGIDPRADPPGPCATEKGGGLPEVTGDEVVDGDADAVDTADKVVGPDVAEGGGEACVDGLQGLQRSVRRVMGTRMRN